MGGAGVVGSGVVGSGVGAGVTGSGVFTGVGSGVAAGVEEGDGLGLVTCCELEDVVLLLPTLEDEALDEE